MKRKLSLRFIVTSAVVLVLAIVLIVGNVIATFYGSALEQFFGVIGASGATTKGAFSTAYESADEVTSAAEKVCKEIEDEGIVLLKNDDSVLPLNPNTEKNISLFGVCSVEFYSGGTGSGSVKSDVEYSLKTTLTDNGFKINNELWNFYESGAGKDYRHGKGSSTNGGGDFKLNEVPQSVFASAGVTASYSSYNDAAIIVIGRRGGEGSDIPRNMKNYGGSVDKHYLEFTDEEISLMSAVKAAGFKKTILILNTGNAMELGDLDSLGIDACIWVGYTGTTGIQSVADVIAGNVNPSGKTVDTYVYDNFSAPAATNMGDFNYTGTNYHYVVYSESVYVGYRYYETRYADVISNRQNVGDYDYSKTVLYPFGYGKSYTDFVWSNFTVKEADGIYTATVNVKNNGKVSGKDVVELYYSSPYTQYDIDNRVEKPAVELLGFAKTPLLKSGEDCEVKIEFKLEDMKSYDAYGYGGYILESTSDEFGKYYVTAATDAHNAVNNILAERGYTVDASSVGMTYGIEISELIKCETEKSTGVKIENRFDFADITDESCLAYDADFKYLTRNDWNGSMPVVYATGNASDNVASDNPGGKQYNRTASAELVAGLDARGYEASGNPKSQSDYKMPTTNKNSDIMLDNFTKVAYDEKAVIDGVEHDWSELLDKMSASDYQALMSAGYSTAKIESIGKIKTKDLDGPAGISAFVGTLSLTAYPAEVVVASTWNVELAKSMGEIVGEEGLWANVQGWYAPAINIHRDAFAGRNYEYYSEDPFLSGELAAAVVSGAQLKGMYCYVKHFAVNDQETHRSITGNCVWLNEQTLREIYLEPFRIATVKTVNSGATAMMSSFNRIGHVWAGGCYALITEVLRGEWGMNGFVLTDYYGGPYMDTNQLLAAGADALLTNGKASIANSTSAATVTLMREASRRILSTVAQSSRMNADASSTSTGFPVYIVLLIVIDVVFVAVAFVLEWFAIRKMIATSKASVTAKNDEECN